MDCTYCHGSNCTKKGKRNGNQRYFCKTCRRSFQENYVYKAYDHTINDMIKNLLKEGCGIRSISRILNISCGTILSRMLKISKTIKVPHFNKLGCNFEVDELWSFIGSKKSVVWITYAMERETR